ncbi:MAG: serine O-acetyltransferase [Euryarchaeota archaeon]|jgi:serine O-acetyltransferase|nr:serine O-acetyltransferase [Euryarchaeota archaeon]MDN5340107.1 serine O-acetyltransferase [Euryarchaeota archaeon]
MIRSREDYRYYLEADRVALKIEGTWRDRFFNDIWRFQRLLRKLEYYMNCKQSLLWRPYILYLNLKHIYLGRRLGFHIPPNVFGPGLSIAHVGTLIVNENVRVGENCRIHNCVHLATQCGSNDACPVIGDNVFIGPGVVMFGDIRIADGIVIGANSVVNTSFLEEGITIAGAPARKVSDKGFDRCYIRATEIVRNRSTNLPAGVYQPQKGLRAMGLLPRPFKRLFEGITRLLG